MYWIIQQDELFNFYGSMGAIILMVQQMLSLLSDPFQMTLGNRIILFRTLRNRVQTNKINVAIGKIVINQGDLGPSTIEHRVVGKYSRIMDMHTRVPGSILCAPSFYFTKMNELYVDM